MPSRIEDYALIGDCQTAALVGRDGSIDWLCFPRFDSGACFAALLGTPDNGRWLLAPAEPIRSVQRRYRPGTLILETEFETEHGAVTLIDFMPERTRELDLIRIVVGKRGRVPMSMELIIRFDYGSVIPWVTKLNSGVEAVAGPDRLGLHSPVPLRGEGFTTVADFTIEEGQRLPFVLQWQQSSLPLAGPVDAENLLSVTEEWWTTWSNRCTYQGPWHDAVLRSLITLKALTYAPTGGIVAAATTSLPEQLGGVRNWDYRFCWLRDATFTLYSLMMGGYMEEAAAWRTWLLRAVAGQPSEANIMYGLAGERRLPEFELDWLAGYEGARPVRIGNAAHRQFQLDVFGEVLDAFYLARRKGLEPNPHAWAVAQNLVEFVESVWNKPDEGIWEVRGPRRHFTHSKMMAWVSIDRMIKGVEQFGHHGPVERWRKLRQEIHDEVCSNGFDTEKNAFVQYFGGKGLDASLLMIPLVGFLPPEDPRVKSTVAAIEKELVVDGLVLRYLSHPDIDGLPPGEGVFLPCSFWLADNLALLGRRDDACRLYERLLELRNDLGLLSEEYDPHARRLVGNFPQAFCHVALVNSACNLTRAVGPAEDRKRS